jgi:hypothetical protein
MDRADKDVRSFVFVGESHFEGYLFPSTAFAAVESVMGNTLLTSTNWGQSSCRSAEFYTNFDNYLKAGLGATDIVIHTLSGNDATGSRVSMSPTVSAEFEFAQSFLQTTNKIDEYISVGCRPWVVLMPYGGGGSGGPNGSVSYADYCARIRAMCAYKKIPLVDIALGWQYNGTWMPDNVHPAGPAITHWNTRFEAALRAEFGV